MADGAANVTEQQMDTTQLKLFVRFEPGNTFADEGMVLIWLGYIDHTADVGGALAFLAWTEGLGISPLVTDSRKGTLRFRVADFMSLIHELFAASQPAFQLSDGALLYVRMFRAAWQLVEARDVIAFACPLELSFPDVFAACLTFAHSDEDSLTVLSTGKGKWSTGMGEYMATWIPAWSNPRMRAVRMLYISMADELFQSHWHRGYRWSQREHGQVMTDAWFFACVQSLMKEVIEQIADSHEAEDRKSSYRVMYRGEEEVLARWKQALCQVDKAIFQADGWLVTRTLRQSLQGSGWRSEWLLDRSGSVNYRIEFELIPPSAKTDLPDWELRFGVVHQCFATKASLATWWNSDGRKWVIGRDVLMEPDVWILPALRRAGQIYAPILTALQAPAPYRCLISPDEVFELVTEKLPELREQGFSVRAPELDGSHVSNVRIRVRVKRGKQKSGSSGVAHFSNRFFDSEQLVDFDWSVVVENTELTRHEFEQLVAKRTPYIQLGGSWRLIPIDEILKQVQEFGGLSHGQGTNILDLSRVLLMNEDGPDEESAVQIDVSYEDEAMDVSEVLRILSSAHAPKHIDPPTTFHGTLRHYQAIGYAWLLQLREIGCGACLADDMGLGKTIQVIAYLLQLKAVNESKGVHLLICPTSLLQNWKAEIARFAPDLKVHVHHGAKRNDALEHGCSPLEDAMTTVDLVMTTYATTVRDIEWFQNQSWDVVIADEAQNIKNADTKQSLAVCSLPALHRIALTGTPVENRLEELWAIFRFANPGYLGSLSWFRKIFADPISQNPKSALATRLQKLLKPVLLRRRKTEPEIQVELPEKWEVCEHSGLTAEQAALYQSIVNQLFTGIDHQVGMSRRGQILAALVRLKQVCDHPCLITGGSGSVSRSGKLKLLLDLLVGVLEEGESALIFTQFRDMGELLCDATEAEFGFRPKFLHGGLSAQARGQIVEDYQSGEDKSPILVLSLKAGGVGLNLTRANHVFHFDRWWNPAVEDQATDRAFRIGQVRDVQVHKLVCSGTLEDRIDALISSKRQLSQAIVGGSEGWVTEMDDATLRALFQLDVDVALEEDD